MILLMNISVYQELGQCLDPPHLKYLITLYEQRMSRDNRTDIRWGRLLITQLLEYHGSNLEDNYKTIWGIMTLDNSSAALSSVDQFSPFHDFTIKHVVAAAVAQQYNLLGSSPLHSCDRLIGVDLLIEDSAEYQRQQQKA